LKVLEQLEQESENDFDLFQLKEKLYQTFALFQYRFLLKNRLLHLKTEIYDTIRYKQYGTLEVFCCVFLIGEFPY
jgi:hypothetical protein